MRERIYSWQAWRYALRTRRAIAQSQEIGSDVRVWFYDGGEEHVAFLWRGQVPYTVLGSYSQAQNDADLAEYDAGEVSFNQAIDARTHDGRLVVQPVTVDNGLWHYWTSVGDSATTLRAGTPFEVDCDGTEQDGNTVVTWQFRDPIFMAGGRLEYEGAQLGDHASFCVYAPSTTVVANGNNTGNCNVSNGVIVPAAGNGAYDVDLDDVHPVPAPGNTGFWSYTVPQDLKLGGTVAPGSPGASSHHLLTVRKELVQFIAEKRMLGTREATFEPQNISPNICLPEWRFECTIHNAGGHTLKVTWGVLITRAWTTE